MNLERIKSKNEAQPFIVRRGVSAFRIADTDIDRFLAEDVPFGDLTTHLLGIGARPARMTLRARDDMVVSCTEEASRLIERSGGHPDFVVGSGTTVRSGDVVLIADGSAGDLMTGWKVAQVLIEYASGIATAARAIVDAACAVRPNVTVACTRKTFPGTKAVAVKAIMAGGAVIHRLGLSETILLFPMHRAFLDENSLAATVNSLKTACPEKKIVVEVNSVAEAVALATAGADVVQLERFSPADVREVVNRVASGVTVAATGGVNRTNAASYAEAGATVLVTSAPYQAPPLDIKVCIEPRD